jgi:hypothetical protein
MSETYRTTRRSLHALGELVLAGPRFRTTGDLRLRVQSAGFSTWDAPFVTLSGGDLVAGEHRFGVDGLTYNELAARVGLVASPLDDVYGGGPGVHPEEVARVDADAAGRVQEALAVGDAALRAFRADAERTLWPEHFDVATTIDGVNFGVSPGDAYSDEPYAYVGPHDPRAGEFWNAPFGAARRLDDLGGRAAVTAFFAEGARLAAHGGSVIHNQGGNA